MKNTMEFFLLLKNYERKHGENAIEYVGYRDVKNFVMFLQHEINIPIPDYYLSQISDIHAYGDVFFEFEDLFSEERIYKQIKEKIKIDFFDYELNLALTAHYLAHLDTARQKELIQFYE